MSIEALENCSQIWIDNQLKEFCEKQWLTLKRNQGLIFSKSNTWNDIIKHLLQRDKELERFQEERSTTMWDTVTKNNIASTESESEVDQISSSLSVSDSEVDLLLDLDAKKKAEEIKKARNRESPKGTSERASFYPEPSPEVTSHDYAFRRVRRNTSVIYKRKPTQSEEREILLKVKYPL
jgi:hypothetical protein